ncbi:major facilitator superfamily MFS-1 [Lentinus brumalis]|uniref:Major facilitator superfamily MFS-1 n=1 Tax=Lentinus brumalis TaxID=2498619 RepID=A0A371CY61_9APHY|nr:major facilitator superfamily MFS-1 [Polyporus brumalis]
MPPRRVFGPGDSALDADSDAPGIQDEVSRGGRRPSARVSFSGLVRKPSILSRWSRNGVGDEESGTTATPDRPAIPSALQPPGEAYATPLPALSMIVLSITMLGEFLSANVSAPFLLFMVEGFDQFHDESEVGYWTGLLVSTFFLTQFLTSLLWATVAAKHGPRVVLTISLLGSAVTCCLFGTSTSIQQAIAIRLMQGVFAGAIGVARGCVASITDPSNEGRAYAILGFCWGFGGVSGAIVGGTFENPAKKWPSVFADMPLFVKYPYLLPCCVAASVTFTGSLLSLFLGPDCGPREGAIRLPPEKLTSIPEEESRPSTPYFEETEERSFYGSMRKKVSGYFAKHSPELEDASPGPSHPVEASVPLVETPTRSAKPRTFSRVSRGNGSAYGYSGAYRNRLASAASMASRRGSNAMSLRRRRESNYEGAPSSVATGNDLNFAQRLLMANENAVTNIADLWVAAAINADNEDPFEESDDEYGELAVGEDDEQAVADEEDEDEFGTPPTHRNNRFSRRTSSATVGSAVIPSSVRPSTSNNLYPSPFRGSPRRPSSARRFSNLRRGSTSLAPGGPEADELPMRRPSSVVPPIFSHVGVRTPPAVLEAQQLLAQAEAEEMDALAPIAEQRVSRELSPAVAAEKEPSLWSQLPMAIIFQYGCLALHSTTHDQVFYLYLVSKYPSGGLNLNAGHFSQLIALMCLAQIAYQFVLYPNIGPPRGRFSHLSMFRLGSMLFIPSYLTVILYRVFASDKDDGNLVLMSALALSTAVRFCGSTFSYTAISVLLNYMSPPHLVGYANGIAQSIVSLARFAGPIIGGTLWSTSVQDGPAGYPLGFIVCAAACGLAIIHSFFIR